MKKFPCLLFFIPTIAVANPYFRPIDISHPYKIAGAWIDPKDFGNSTVGSAIALATHDPKDGCWLPSVVCEDWSPAAVGLSANAGHVSFNIGPVVNMVPMAWSALTTAFPTLKGLFVDTSVTFSFGPALQTTPIANGTIQPFNHWQPGFRLFTGAAIKF